MVEYAGAVVVHSPHSAAATHNAHDAYNASFLLSCCSHLPFCSTGFCSQHLNYCCTHICTHVQTHVYTHAIKSSNAVLQVYICFYVSMFPQISVHMSTIVLLMFQELVHVTACRHLSLPN